MPATNLSTFIMQLAEKAGIESNNQALVDFLAHTELNRITIAPDLERAINQNLLSLDDAKANHPAVKTHYFAEVMSNVDRALTKLYQGLGLEQEDIDELARETSSTKRIVLVGEKLKDIMNAKVEEAKKTKPKDSEQVTQLQQQVNDLNEKLRIEKENRTADKTKYETDLTGFKKNTALTGKIAALKTIYDELPADVRSTTIITLINKELQDSNVHFVLDDNGNLKPQKTDGTNYFDENNRQVSADDFIQKALAKHKVLKQAPANNGGENQNRNGQQQQQQQQSGGGNGRQPVTVENGGRQNPNAAISSLIDESLKSLETTNPLTVAAGK